MVSKLMVSKLEQIKVIATDVDGVLTEGFVFIQDDHDEPFGKFNIVDGFAIGMARECGIITAVVSGRKSLATEARCSKLGIDLAFTGIRDKLAKVEEIANELGVSLHEIAYIGDDLIDLPALLSVGFSCAPRNAVAEVKSRVDYVSSLAGGEGVLREIVELVLKTQNKYEAFLAQYLP